MALNLQLKHDTETNWNLYGSKVLLDGEIAVVHMTNGETKLKVGNGTTQFRNLKYVNDLDSADITVNSMEVSGQFTLNNENVATEKFVTDTLSSYATEQYVDDKFNSLLGGGEPADDDLPKIFWTGTLPTVKEQDGVKIENIGKLTYKSKTQELTCYATFAVQGDSSASYNKKNFTIKTYSSWTSSSENTSTKIQFKNWPKMNKFVMKAHWIDHSHIRNVGCAKIWNKIMEARADYDQLPTELTSTVCHGATDGFSVRFWNNGQYYGLYEIIIPKNMLFNMDKNSTTASLLNSDWNNKLDCSFGTNTPTLVDRWGEEFAKTTPTIAETSFKNFITFVNSSTNTAFKANFENYCDLQSVIDFDIFARIFCIVDNLCKNQLFATYDGVKWWEGAWDLDATMGNPPMLNIAYLTYNTKFQDDYFAYKYYQITNKLYQRVEENFKDRVLERYNELRSNVLEANNIIKVFEQLNDNVAQYLDEDVASTTGTGNFGSIPYQTDNTIQQIRKFIVQRLEYMDEAILDIGDGNGDVIEELEVVKQNGQSTQDLTFTPMYGYKYEYKVGYSSDSIVTWGPHFCSTSYSNGNRVLFLPLFRLGNPTKNEIFVRAGTNEATLTIGQPDYGKPYIYTYDGTTATMTDGETNTLLGSVNCVMPTDWVADSPFKLFGVYNNTAAANQAKNCYLWYMRAWNGEKTDENLVLDIVPARKTSKDGVVKIGVYDRVSETFYTGTNGFVIPS